MEDRMKKENDRQADSLGRKDSRMAGWKPGTDGYIMQYMTAGPLETPFASETKDANQLRLEARLRREIEEEMPDEIREELPDSSREAAGRSTADPAGAVRLGEPASNGCPWGIQASSDNVFIDVSGFYSTLHKINFEAAAVLSAAEDCTVTARLWSYMAVTFYLNGRKAGCIQDPIYKPVHSLTLTLKLRAGRNLLHFFCRNLGVRDTRNMLAMQILDHRDEIMVLLPDASCQEAVSEDLRRLSLVRIQDDRLVLPDRERTEISFRRATPDYEESAKPDTVICADSRCGAGSAQGEERQVSPAASLPENGEKDNPEWIAVPQDISLVKVTVKGERYTLSRRLEFSDRIQPVCLPAETAAGMSDAENHHRIFEEIAAIKSLNRGEFGFAIMDILARKAVGREEPGDRERLLSDLSLIEQRVDCADFLVCGLIRYMKNYPMDPALSARAREVLLSFRYWMNMQGSDGMCFWSENHSLMFYQSAMLIGEMYPENWFSRAEMSGRALSEYGRGKVLQWLDDVEKDGFEEFLSTVYMCVTFAALLNLVDYGPEDISRRASALCDRLLRELALQSFKGSVIAPMGRVYRGVIYPFTDGAQSILHYIDPAVPYTYGEGWLAYLCTSRYRMPAELKSLMQAPAEVRYETGNAEICLVKNDGYCLTSVASPREDGSGRKWENIRNRRDADTDTHLFNKSFNESFHGTSFFQPGTFGYQQHMWYAALSGSAVLFANHPGTTSEQSDMRPGYWYGNGLMPAVKQDRDRIGTVYVCEDSFPIRFTHVYCPLHRFSRSLVTEHWIFLAAGKGYLALWSSGKLIPYQGMLTDCEFRVYDSENAYYCFAGRKEEYSSLEDFAAAARAEQPEYDRKTRCLTARDFRLCYVHGDDRTQIIE